jgi:hypothetical protein
MMERMALLNDRLFLTVYGQQILPGAGPAGRPDPAHWQHVLVSCIMAHLTETQSQL